MATSFTDIYDLFLVQLRDYRIDLLADLGESNLNEYLKGFLKFAIDRFSRYCDQDIVTTANYTTGQFSITVDNKNQIMLAKEMKLFWVEREVNDVLQFQLLLTDADFKRHAESSNLKEKRILQDKIMEQISQDEFDYFVRYNRSASDWEARDFFV